MSEYNFDRNAKARWAFFSVLAIVAFFVAVFCPAPAKGSHGDCVLPGRNTPARPVPECVNSVGHAVACQPGAIRLWPRDFRPASNIPLSRDTTDRFAGNTIPGSKSGHELFSSVALVEVNGKTDQRLYVSYNAGMQVWELERDPANPHLRAGADGWEGQFLSFPHPDEVLSYIEDISPVNTGDMMDLVAVAGKGPVGLSIWRYDAFFNSLMPLYQDTGLSAFQTRAVKHAIGSVAYAGSGNGVAVYDMSRAAAMGSSCVDNQGGGPCPLVYQGTFAAHSDPFRTTLARYIDVVYRPDTDSVLVAAAGGFRVPVTIWELRFPENPMSAELVWTGPLHAQGVAFVERAGDLYLAFVDETQGFSNERLEIRHVDCDTNCILTPVIDPVDISGFPTASDFLSASYINGKPYLYYGFGTGFMQGPNLDRLWSLRGLRPPEQINFEPSSARLDIVLRRSHGESHERQRTENGELAPLQPGRKNSARLQVKERAALRGVGPGYSPKGRKAVATGSTEQVGGTGVLDTGAATSIVALPEITADGGAYTDPCSGVEIRYWSHYYHANAHGLNGMVPRIGRFSSEGYFYRASATVLDVHRLEMNEIFSDGFETGDTSRWNSQR